MNLRSAAVTDWNQKPKPNSVHNQMNNPAAALPIFSKRHGCPDSAHGNGDIATIRPLAHEQQTNNQKSGAT
jgi:hypothetical protein